jgi:ketose-bisphosphate aldolase
MALYRNVRPLLMDTSADRDTALARPRQHLKRARHRAKGDVYAITCGEPMGAPGGTNMLKICRAVCEGPENKPCCRAQCSGPLKFGVVTNPLPTLPWGYHMALVSMRELLDHAAANGYGIPAFNVNNLEQVQAVMAAAEEVGAPVILQASAGARKYAGEAFIKHLIQAAVEAYPGIPLVMHQDHGQSPEVCQGAINLGFSSVMMDGSLMEDGKTIASYDYNVDVTRKVVDMAHKLGVTVEGELGCLGSLETMKRRQGRRPRHRRHHDARELLTDPKRPPTSSRRTQLDALAIAIGTSHGAYKFTPQAHRRHPGDQTASRKSTAASPTPTW